MFLQLTISSICLALLLTDAAYAQFDETKLQSLFMTVDQRKRVDDIRNGKDKIIVNEQPAIVKKSEKITVTGFVKRSDGKNVVWTSDGSTINSNILQGIQIQTNSINQEGQVTVIIDGQHHKLKPGESWSHTGSP